MGIANVINVTGSAGGGEIIRELINSSDGQGLHFDGVAGGINLGSSMPDLGTKYSLEFVVKGDSNTGEVYLIDAYKSGARIIFAWSGSSSGNIQLHINGTWSSSFMATPENGEVVHLILSVDGTSATLYKNGNAESTQTVVANTMTSATSSHIGSSQNGTGNFFNGSAYRTRFYNKALTQAEVDSAYQSVDIPFADEYGSQTSLVDANASTFVGTSTYGWVKYGNNTIANTSNQLVITYVDNVEGAYNYLKNSTDLTTDLTVGKKYKIKIDAKYAGGSAGVKLKIHDGASNTEFGTLTTSLTTYEVEFTAQSATGAYIKLGDMSASNVVTLDNFYVYRCGAVTDYDLAFANPTQSLMVQDRAGVADGTASAGVSQTQEIVQLNSTAIAVSAATARTPADGDIIADKIGVDCTPTVPLDVVGVAQFLATGSYGLKLHGSNGNQSGILDTYGNHDLEFRVNNSKKMVIDTSGETKIIRTGDEPCLELATDNAGCKLLFARGGDPTAYIRMYEDGSTGSGSLRFATGTSATPVERLKIDTAGLVTSTLSSANTNTAGVALKLDHTTSGSSAVGFGTLIRFDGERTGSTSDGMGTMGFVADSMSASRVDGAFVVNTGQDGSYTERLRISSTGNLSVGSGADIGGSGVATFTAAEKIEMRAAGAESPQFLASCYSATSSRCASIAFKKSHTNTGGVLDATVDGENLGKIIWKGISSGDGERDSAEISAVCDGAPDGSDQPAKLVFKTSSTSETLGTRLTIGPTGLATFADGVTVSGGFTTLGGFNDLTIASGAVTATSSTHNIDTEGGGATDYLDTINGGSTGSIITLMAASGSRTVVVEDGTNLKLAGDCTLDNAEDTITLIKSGSAWHEVSRSNNGA
jgi:hypothetical protein